MSAALMVHPHAYLHGSKEEAVVTLNFVYSAFKETLDVLDVVWELVKNESRARFRVASTR